jgi:hypothetical protein
MNVLTGLWRWELKTPCRICHTGREEHTILPEDKAGVVHLACTQPKELGYAAEL